MIRLLLQETSLFWIYTVPPDLSVCKTYDYDGSTESCFVFTDVKSKDETIALLKETLGEQENMLQMQEEYINKKEEEINSGKTGNLKIRKIWTYEPRQANLCLRAFRHYKF